jgi:hypothetical protein
MTTEKQQRKQPKDLQAPLRHVHWLRTGENGQGRLLSRHGRSGSSPTEPLPQSEHHDYFHHPPALPDGNRPARLNQSIDGEHDRVSPSPPGLLRLLASAAASFRLPDTGLPWLWRSLAQVKLAA